MNTLKKRTRLAAVATSTLTGSSIFAQAAAASPVTGASAFAITAPGPVQNRATRRANRRKPGGSEAINECTFDDAEYLDAS